MKRLWLLPIVALLLFASCKKQPAAGRAGAVTEAELIGDWTTLKGDAEYVTFAKADGEYSYGAYLRGRPLYTGTWKLERGKLTIIADNGTETVYDRVAIKDGRLDLNDGAEQYERFVVKTGADMVKELLGEAAKATAAGFSSVKAVEMTWHRQQEAEVEALSLKGWRMSAEIKVKGDFTELNELAGKIAAFFVDDKGFVQDELNVTETASGYTLGNYVLLVSVRADPEPIENEPAFVDVTCGWAE